MTSLDQLKYDYWVAEKTVAALRADLCAAEVELNKIADAVAVESARARCGPVVVA